MIFRYFILLVFMVLFAASAKADEAPAPTILPSPFIGSWKNQAGSLVTFKITEGIVRGTYQTNIGQPDKNKSFELIGFTQGDQITFTVNFKGFGSMTAWTGQLTIDDKNTPYIRTLWHLTRDVPDDKEQENIWSSVITGASNFVRVNKIED